MDLLMPFVKSNASFVHGFECGQIWEWAKNGKVFNNYVFHSENKIQVEMILELHGYDYGI